MVQYNQGLEQGGMREVALKFYHLLRNDDQLMRLLFYRPEDFPDDSGNPSPHPLSETLPFFISPDPNDPTIPVIDAITKWEITKDRIAQVKKVADLEERAICRLHLYAGYRKPTRNYMVANQEIVIEVFTHESYEEDLRSLWISDRINQLLVDEHVAGMGKVIYLQGRQVSAPKGYTGYQHTYVIGDGIK